MKASFWERHFLAATVVLLLAMAVLEAASMRTESQTFDESYHLLGGYSYLKTGRIPGHSEHPPLAQIASAWPLLFFGLRVPEVRSIDAAEELRREREFLYGSPYPADTLLLVTRSAHLLITLLLGALIAWWTRARFGAAAGLAALWLYVFDPNFLAHGRYTTTDVPAAACFLLGCLAWNRFLANPRLANAALCGVATGIAMATKYSAVLLFESYVVLYLFCWLRDPMRFRLRDLVKSVAVVGGVMFLVIYAVFGFETGTLLAPGSTVTAELSAKLQKNPETAGSFSDLILTHPAVAGLADRITHTPIPMPSLFRGLYYTGSHAAEGHDTYLLGKFSKAGWWYYFPVMAAVKTPTGDILLFVLAVAVAAARVFGSKGALRIEWFTLTIPPIVYFVAAICAHINVGFRHLLPIYPFVFIWMAAVLFGNIATGRAVRVAAMACLGLVALESLLVFPHYLAFFNTPAGGARGGARIAVDSNLDWGQDLKQVKPYLDAHGISNVCLGYFGVAPPEYYGITARPVPASLADAQASGCVVVMSLSLLYERNFRGQYDWLRRMEPVGAIGDSFRVYDPGRAAAP